MNTATLHAGAVLRILARSKGGVVGLVDDLLRLCRQHRLQIDWQPDCFKIRAISGGQDEVVDARLRPSVFRAVLARIAALCNLESAESVSPYGGNAILPLDSELGAFLQVSFCNTSNEQWLKLRPLIRRDVLDDDEVVLEGLADGPMTYARLRHYLYLSGCELRPSQCKEMIRELIAEALVENQSNDGQIALTPRGRSVMERLKGSKRHSRSVDNAFREIA